jgi:hypothetical protein
MWPAGQLLAGRPLALRRRKLLDIVPLPEDNAT